MRKAKLIEQNELLFNQVENLRHELSKTVNELEAVKKELACVKASAEPKRMAENKSPFEKLEEQITAQKEETPDGYGAKAIGRVVVAATAVTSEYAESTKSYAKERINLVLGGAEVAKAEILKIVSEDGELNDKKIRIDSVAQKAIEYINGLKSD